MLADYVSEDLIQLQLSVADWQEAVRAGGKLLVQAGKCESRYVDAHHIHHWADGGETSLENLVTLCRFHHRQLHKGCFEVRVEGVSAETRGEEPRLVFARNAEI